MNKYITTEMSPIYQILGRNFNKSCCSKWYNFRVSAVYEYFKGVEDVYTKILLDSFYKKQNLKSKCDILFFKIHVDALQLQQPHLKVKIFSVILCN